MLRLRKVLTAEELASNESNIDETWSPSTPITDQQITDIDISNVLYLLFYIIQEVNLMPSI